MMAGQVVDGGGAGMNGGGCTTGLLPPEFGHGGPLAKACSILTYRYVTIYWSCSSLYVILLYVGPVLQSLGFDAVSK